jgi:hypothetical protein
LTLISQPRQRSIGACTFAIAVLLNFACGAAAEIDFLTAASLTPEIRAAFEKQLLKRYLVSTQVNPFYLHGDFDGDGQADTALLIKERSSGKSGIAILHGKSNRIAVVERDCGWATVATNFPGWTLGTFSSAARYPRVPPEKRRPSCAVTR